MGSLRADSLQAVYWGIVVLYYVTYPEILDSGECVLGIRPSDPRASDPDLGSFQWTRTFVLQCRSEPSLTVVQIGMPNMGPIGIRDIPFRADIKHPLVQRLALDLMKRSVHALWYLVEAYLPAVDLHSTPRVHVSEWCG